MSQGALVPELQALGETLIRAWQGRSASEREVFASRVGVASEVLAEQHENGTSIEAVASGDEEHQAAWAHFDAVPSEPAPSKAEPYPEAKVATGSEAFTLAVSEPHGWPEPRISETTAALERKAAVSGAVRPVDLTAGYPAAVASLLLDRLAPSFDRTRKAGAWAWTLRSERRAAVLRGLDPDALAAEVAAAGSLPTDAAGTALRRILAGEEPPEPEGVREALAIAYCWAAAVQPDRAHQVAALRLDLARRNVLAAFDHLLQDGFVGREGEIARLREFVGQARSGPEIPILTVSGIGGSGKSTLLAQALRLLLANAFDDQSAPLVVSIDFDRSAFLTGGELELSFELSRQLELFFPEIAPELKALREAVGRERAERGENSKDQTDAALESVSRHSAEFEYRAQPIVRDHGANRRPLVVVLDTFEEWQRGAYTKWDPQAPASRVLAWLSMLRDAWNLRLGVIVSGRTPVPPDSYFAAPRAIQLEELGRRESIELLVQLGLRSAAAGRLARLVGGNPLSLKLAARYFLRLSREAQAAFLADAGAELEGVDAALRQGMLYKRFLDHIADPKARKLAHPGLALRRVTPELIREVLATPCGLGELGAWAAEDLFTLLAREVWLVEGRGAELVHRPEIRTVMLRAMRGDPEQADRVHAVHAAAQRWYEQRPTPTPQDREEAVYHRLVLAHADDFGAVTADVPREVLQSLARSADDLLDPVRVRLLHYAGRRLVASEAALLPRAERLDWASTRCEEAVRSGRPDQAISLWNGIAADEIPGPWYAAAAFQAELWDGRGAVLREGIDDHTPSLRYHYLLTLVMEEKEPDEARRLRGTLDKVLQAQLANPRRRSDGSQVLESLYFADVVGRRDARRIQHGSEYPLDAREAFSANRYLRVSAVTNVDSMAASPVASRKLLAGAFRPTADFLDLVAHRLVLAGVDGAATRRFHEELVSAMDAGLRSAEVLGKWSDRFARAVAEDLSPHPRGTLAVAALFRGLPSDDPEWRVPLRNAMAATVRGQHQFEAWAIDEVSNALGRWTPADLWSEAFFARRVPWIRILEYIDRCGELPRFIEACLARHRPRLERVGRAYLEWVHLRDSYVGHVTDGEPPVPA